MMMVIIELPMAQIISLKIMGVAARTKAPNITRSNLRRSWRRNWILCSRRNRNQATMRKSTTRAMAVASAAPWISRRGAPRLPKMNTQLKKTFTIKEVE